MRPSERAAERRRRAQEPTSATAKPVETEIQRKTVGTPERTVLAQALPTTKVFPHRISLDITPEAYRRLTRLSYELATPKGALLRKLFDTTPDEDIANLVT